MKKEWYNHDGFSIEKQKTWEKKSRKKIKKSEVVSLFKISLEHLANISQWICGDGENIFGVISICICFPLFIGEILSDICKYI